MRYSISDTAEYGDVSRGPRIVTPATKKMMQKILKEIQSGKFAKEWIAESESGRVNFNALRKAGAEHHLVGDALFADDQQALLDAVDELLDDHIRAFGLGQRMSKLGAAARQVATVRCVS